ncbi:M14 family metallopeptidase [Treponema sp.]|uniref:M14 family metallopeptidase n=1 Tax=Treponema sp. TaxID=166 RepID=UPI00298E7649|nr:M14 family metallopeptidase [Treponema sp.]MCQ2240342.1 M14 family metallopeptidase [Treponema sp.]
MIKTVTTAELPVNETFSVQKQKIKNGRSHKRVCIVTGTHGDELEGQYVCWNLIQKVRENIDQLDGILEIYPALNPLGVNAMTRGVPQFDLDMNRIFPGNHNGTFVEYTAAEIIDDLDGADVVVDIHASNIFLTEVPQVRVNVESVDYLMNLAKSVNCDFIWVHSAATVLESTLAYTLNSIDTPTLVVEMGVGMRITKEYGDQLTEGLLNLMKEIGIWKGETQNPRIPLIGRDEDNCVAFLNADKSGVFLPSAKHWTDVKKGQEIGKIINPLTGDTEEVLTSPIDGKIFTIREYPIVYAGSLIARVLDTSKTAAKGDE